MALMAALLMPAPATAADRPWTPIAARVAEPWPGLQHRHGSFPDLVVQTAPDGHRDNYGTAALGFGLLHTGARDGDRRALDAGLRAIGRAIARPTRKPSKIFEHLAVAAAYNVARNRARSNPIFRRIKGRWENRLRAIDERRLRPDGPYSNWDLVESITVLELLRTGLRSRERGAVLTQPARYREIARRVIDEKLPRAVEDYSRDDPRAGRATIVSDPPFNPLAYHALTVGLLARAVELLGERDAPTARRLLANGARASWGLMGPDGDLAYFGRSQEQGWALTMTAYGALTAAGLGGTTATDAARFRAIAERAVGRFERLHVGGRFGMFITPAFAAGDTRGAVAGVDRYATTTGYTGLALMALNWAIEERRKVRSIPPSTVGADEPGHFVLAQGKSVFATVRTPNVWFAVKQLPAQRGGSGTLRFARDLRYDAGLHALKVRAEDGSWRQVLRLRPHIHLKVDSAGPWWSGPKEAGRPYGGRLAVADDGTVTLSEVGFRGPSGGWIRRGWTLRYEPVACGVRMVIPTRAGDRFEHSVFFRRGAGGPRRSAGRLADADQVVTFDHPARVVLEPRRYSSGLDPALVRARLRFAAGSGAPINVTICRP